MSDREKWPSQWHRCFGWEYGWERVGLCCEVSWGYWWPREWTLHITLGPFVFWGGIEACDDFCREHNHFRTEDV